MRVHSMQGACRCRRTSLLPWRRRSSSGRTQRSRCRYKHFAHTKRATQLRDTLTDPSVQVADLRETLFREIEEYHPELNEASGFQPVSGAPPQHAPDSRSPVTPHQSLY